MILMRLIDRNWNFNQVIQAVTFDPLIGGHQQPLKGSRFHHPKKVTSRIATKIHKILGVTIFAQLGTWAIKQFIDVHRGDHREDLAPSYGHACF